MKKFFLTGFLAVAMLVAVSFNAISNDGKMNQLKLKTQNATLEAKAKVENVVSLLKGVDEADLNIKDKTIVIKYDPMVITQDLLVFTIEAIGYKTEIVENKSLSSQNSVSPNEGLTKENSNKATR